MRVIARTAIAEAIRKHNQWKVPLALWLTIFDKSGLRYESFDQFRRVWIDASGWNVDRIPSSKLRDSSKKGPLDVYVFDIKKNECRIVSWVNTKNGTIYIKDVLSHADYDRWWRNEVK